jgi:hypothetical protein
MLDSINKLASSAERIATALETIAKAKSEEKERQISNQAKD